MNLFEQLLRYSSQPRLSSHDQKLKTAKGKHRPNSHPKSPHNRLALNPAPNIALRTVQVAIESQHLLELAVLEVDGRLASLAVGDILGAGGEVGDWEGFDDGCHFRGLLVGLRRSLMSEEME